MNLRMKESYMSQFRINSIKKVIIEDESYKYWNQAIGLTFEDFSIYEIENEKICGTIQKGKTDIANGYAVFIENGYIIQISYDMKNERVRQHTLKLVS